MKKIGLLLLVTLMLFLLAACPAQEDAPQNSAFANMRVKETEIAIDAEAAPILSALGNEISYEESPSCAFEGMDKLYVYQGFRIKTYSQGGKDYIYSIELMDDSIATPEGIMIGAEIATVTEKYGTPAEENDTAMRFISENTILQILFRDGKVTNIQYLKIETTN